MLRSTFQRAGSVAIGTAIGQGTIFAATPFLARIYSPEEFGLLALLLSISNIATMVACLRYDTALPSAPEEDIPGLLRLCLGSSCILAVMTPLAISLLRELDVLTEVVKPLGAIWPTVSLCIFLAGAFQASAALLLRMGAYRSVGLLRASQGMTFSTLGLIPTIGLAWAYASSFLGGLIALRRIGGRGLQSLPLSAIASKYKEFTVLNLPGAILDVVGCNVCLWTVISHYGQEAGGELSQVQRLIGGPLMIISLSLGQTLLRQTAELSRDKNAIKTLLVRLLTIFSGSSLAAIALLYFTGEPLIGYLLGERWSISREMIIAVSIAVFVRACVSPLSSVLVTYRRFDLGIAWQGLYFASAMILFPQAALMLTFEHFLIFFAAHELMLYAVYLGLIIHSVKD